MKSIEYNNDYIKTLEQLSYIYESIIIEKQDDQIVVKSGTTDGNVNYKLTAPVEHFAFEGEECSFRAFREFYKLFSILDKPSISQNKNYLELSKDKSKIKYVLSDSETIKQVGSEISDFGECTTHMTLSIPLLKKIRGMCSSNVLNTNKMRVQISGTELTFTLFSDKHQNTFTETLELTKESTRDLDFVMFTNIFGLIPESDYKWSFTGIVDDALDRVICLIEFDLLTMNGYELKLYTAEVE